MALLVRLKEEIAKKLSLVKKKMLLHPRTIPRVTVQLQHWFRRVEQIVIWEGTKTLKRRWNNCINITGEYVDQYLVGKFILLRRSLRKIFLFWTFHLKRKWKCSKHKSNTKKRLMFVNSSIVVWFTSESLSSSSTWYGKPIDYSAQLCTALMPQHQDNARKRTTTLSSKNAKIINSPK